MAETMTVDVLILGFGKAGKTIALKRAKAGDRVAIVEASTTMYGGTCINIGCVPTKRLLVDAHRGVPYPEARNERDTLIAKLNAANKAMQESGGVVVIDGTARFTGSHTVEVSGGEQQLTIDAEVIVINTGSTPVIPDISGITSARVLDSTTAQQCEERPESLAIIGAGPIGLEFASMFAAFGSQVTVLNGSAHFLPHVDTDIAAGVRADLESRGITIVDGAAVTAIEEVAGGVIVRHSAGEVEAERALVAVGRRPHTDGLDVEAAGITLTERGGIRVDEHLRTTVDGVYAAGDVTGGPQFTYISYDDHRVILDDRWGSGARTTTGRIFPTTIFLDPPLSHIGLNESEARSLAEKEGFDLAVKAADIADMAIVPRPKILRTPQGRATFLVDASHDRILGATLWCTDSQELINTVALAIREGIPASHLGDGIWTHPSSSEIFNALLG